MMFARQIRTLNIAYWGFLAAVPITDAATFNAYEDSFSIYCDEAMIYYVTHLIKLQQDEFNSSMAYKQLFVEALDSAMREDKLRRSIPELVAPYIGG